MPTKISPTKTTTKTKNQPIRFAHPFFGTTPVATRKAVAGGSRMLTHIEANLEKIPPPKRTPIMTLADVIGEQGAKDVEAFGAIRFHTTGDTGRGANTPQGDVAQAMETDFDVTKPAASPSFFFHLGDVIYGHDKDQRYRPEFYEPYVHYPGKIIGIPGNHDAEVFPGSDATSLKAFQANFCATSQSVPAIAGTIFRQTMNQPAVYWLLDAPFLHVVGLYSNAAENPGFISGTIPGNAQKNWLTKTLKDIGAQRKAGKRKALVFATHHPPFTAGGHSPSTEMLAEIDSICKDTGVQPDMFLSGHAHSYQRYTREVSTMQIPYLVVGTGGISDQAVQKATGQRTGDHVYEKSFKGFGYALVEASKTSLKATMFEVNTSTKAKALFDSVSVNLTTNRLQ
jgi:hypothetical protein